MKTLTIEIPDELYQAFERAAVRDGRPVEVIAREWLAEHCPRPNPPLSDADRRAGRESLRRFAGSVASGDPHFADNDHIDADLADEYDSSHGESACGSAGASPSQSQ